MNRAQDGLSMICQLPQQPSDVPHALTIGTRGWFIIEKEELRLAGEPNTNRQPLGLGADVRTRLVLCLNVTTDRVSVILDLNLVTMR
jgi:hypothetical protein